MGYTFRLAAWVLLYASSHRQDNTYPGLCYTSRGAMAGKRKGSMSPPWRNDLTTHRTMSEHTYHGATSRSSTGRRRDVLFYDMLTRFIYNVGHRINERATLFDWQTGEYIPYPLLHQLWNNGLFLDIFSVTSHHTIKHKILTNNVTIGNKLISNLLSK